MQSQKMVHHLQLTVQLPFISLMSADYAAKLIATLLFLMKFEPGIVAGLLITFADLINSFDELQVLKSCFRIASRL